MRNTINRTVRILHHADELAAKGRNVCVVVRTQREKESLQSDHPAVESRVVFEAITELDDFNWRTLRPQFLYRDWVVIVHPAVIEEHYSDVLEALHRYDEPQ